MIRLVGPLFRNPQVIALCRRQFIQLNADLCKMQTGYFLIQVLWQHIYFIFVLIVMLPQFDLGKRLVTE